MEKLWSKDFILTNLSNFLMAFAFYLIGTTMPFYIEEQFHTTESETGLILASYIIATLILRPFSGFIVDTFSRKKVYIIAYFLFVFVYFGYMWASTITLFIIARMMHGGVWSVITTASSTIAIDVIPAKRRGEGIGFFGLTTTLAMAVGPFIGLYLYEHFDFDYNFYSTIFFGIIGLLTALLIKVPVREIKTKTVISLDRFILKAAIPIGINLLFTAICYGMLFTYAAKYGMQLGIENIGLFFLFMAVGMMATRFFAGKLLDKGYVNQLMIASQATIALSFLLFGIANSEVLFFTSALFIGFGYGIASPTYQTMFVNMGTNDQRGTANSTFFSFYDLGIGLGMVLSGFMATYFNNEFKYLFLICSASATIGIFYYLLISKNIYRIKKNN
ncbi:MFS transporter [Paenimyroides tangerinum]|uniref:MFS transporter n=1 Tax=Paenimyroides tangerinum TaxID=2488728 RepID=A0A3P3VY25_9FLAO|nr:MFS transporter [Paenimyroides tangerinum]RRJ87712.1 MFS transporter [Paenimyroides tangerinum]